MGASLLSDGLLIEGTSDPYGRLWVANLLRKRDSDRLLVEGLLFSTNFRWGFEPSLFQPVLPKDYIHRMQPGEAIHAFFDAWRQAFQEVQAMKAFGLRQLRVRDHLPVARIEVPEQDLAALIEPQVRARIVARFKEIGYTYVSLDLSGFRSGSLNEVLQSDE